MKRYFNFHSVIGTGVFLYILIRSLKVGITYDEAWTLMDFVPTGLTEIFSCIPCDANNHILNTLLIKLVYLFTPHTIFWARLPNVAAGAYYIITSAQISRRFLPRLLGYAFFLLAILNPFLLNFFSLARGYGLAMAFLMASVYQLLMCGKEGNLKQAFAALAIATLAVLCNFALLNFWLGVVFLVFWIMLHRPLRRVYFWKITGIVLLWSFLLLMAIYKPISKLVAQGGLYFGGSTGFYHDTIGSLVRYSLYSPYAFDLAQWVAGILLGLLTLTVFVAIYYRKTWEDFPLSKALIISIVVVIPVLSNVIQHVLLQNLYLIERTALFYFPLFILLLIFWIAEISKPSFQKIAHVITTFLCLSFAINFLLHANFVKTITWEYDAHDCEILKALQAKASANSTHYSVGGVKLFIRGMLYQVKDFPNLSYVPEARLQDSVLVDFYLYYNRDLPHIYTASEQDILRFGRDTILQYPSEGVYVFGQLSGEKP